MDKKDLLEKKKQALLLQINRLNIGKKAKGDIQALSLDKLKEELIKIEEELKGVS